jgi:hypothetical protein
MFFESNDFPGLTIADPFMGGGTPLIEANRVGCGRQGAADHLLHPAFYLLAAVGEGVHDYGE